MALTPTPSNIPPEAWNRLLGPDIGSLTVAEIEQAVEFCTAVGRHLAHNCRLHMADPELDEIPRTPEIFVDSTIAGAVERSELDPGVLINWRRRLADGSIVRDPRFVGFLMGIEEAIASFSATLEPKIQAVATIAGVPLEAVDVDAQAAGGRALMSADGRHFVAFEREEARRLVHAHVVAFPSIVAVVDTELLTSHLGLPSKAEIWIAALDQIEDERLVSEIITALLPNRDVGGLADAVLDGATDWAPYLAGAVARDSVLRETETHLVVELLDINPEIFENDEED